MAVWGLYIFKCTIFWCTAQTLFLFNFGNSWVSIKHCLQLYFFYHISLSKESIWHAINCLPLGTNMSYFVTDMLAYRGFAHLINFLDGYAQRGRMKKEHPRQLVHPSLIGQYLAQPLLDIFLTNKPKSFCHCINVDTGISDFHNLTALSPEHTPLNPRGVF